MSKDYEYLSDDELNKLMELAESDISVSAPESVEAEVLDYITEKEKLLQKKSNIRAVPPRKAVSRNTVSFAVYCLKVFGSIAAAIMILAITPFIRQNNLAGVPTREDIISGTQVKSREEVLSRIPVKTREEVISDESNGVLPRLESIFEMIREAYYETN
ncbi:hypothetical protein [Butyrivibrio sp. AE3009]|uniref:hypothetical protein n=1 Tax=Butyrivibrio sp. AE3009 TaxID=1280666 RepID=UPI0003B5A2DE|nr:hypothetical protein [Butyrivibrio sp. AE3009]